MWTYLSWIDLDQHWLIDCLNDWLIDWLRMHLHYSMSFLSTCVMSNTKYNFFTLGCDFLNKEKIHLLFVVVENNVVDICCYFRRVGQHYTMLSSRESSIMILRWQGVSYNSAATSISKTRYCTPTCLHYIYLNTSIYRVIFMKVFELHVMTVVCIWINTWNQYLSLSRWLKLIHDIIIIVYKMAYLQIDKDCKKNRINENVSVLLQWFLFSDKMKWTLEISHSNCLVLFSRDIIISIILSCIMALPGWLWATYSHTSQHTLPYIGFIRINHHIIECTLIALLGLTGF